MQNIILTPGPTPLPPKVLEAGAKQIIHHRTPQFEELFKEANEGLGYVFQSKNDIFILASSGTGAMEAAVVNLLSPRDKVLVVEGGKFGERWTEICRAYGIEVEVLEVEWGRAVDPKDIESRVKGSGIKAVFTTLCETSTGVNNDIKAIGGILKGTAAVLVVDAISGLGAIELDTDGWGCDVVVSGSQKGLMLPPGLGFISFSPKAWELNKASKCPKYYFDLKLAKKALDQNTTAFTPGITLIIALNEALKMIKDAGLKEVFARHKRMAEAVRAAMKSLGLELLAGDASSDAVTAVKVPEGVDGKKLVKMMRDTYGVTIAGGQGRLKGKIFRIAHMGYITKDDLCAGLECLEKVLKELGYKFEAGAGLAALKERLE